MSTIDLEIAMDYGECSVCMEPLCITGAAVMTSGTWIPPSTGGHVPSIPKRTCRHFLCQKCPLNLVQKSCPVCRREYKSTVNVPAPLQEPTIWFHLVDYNQNGKLEFQELADASKAMFPVDPDHLEEILKKHWVRWDSNHSGAIDVNEFKEGVAPMLSSTLKSLRTKLDPELVDLKSRPAQWFQVWDKDNSGSLERREIVRSLIKTVPGLSGADEMWLTETFREIWLILDPNNDGSITEAEFVMPGGLYEILVANLLT